MSNTIQVKRGADASLPTLNAGEPGFSTDTHDLYVGDGANNHEILMHHLFDANTILKADADNTPDALTVAEQTILGRITAGVISALTPAQVRTLLNVADGANDYTHPNHTGDVTSIADGAQTIGTDKVNDTHIDWGTGANQVLVKDITSYAITPLVVTGADISEGTNAGTFKVAALTALLRSTDSLTGELDYVTLAEQDNQTITSVDTEYIISLNYNAGSPTITIGTTNPYTADKRNIPIGRVMKNSSNDVHYISGGYNFQDGVEKLHTRAKTLRGIELASGSTIAYSGTNNFTMTSGVVFSGINKFTLSSYDSAVTTFVPIYRDGVGGFTEGTPSNTIDYSHYDDGDGTLGTIGNNRYGCFWIYRHSDDSDVYVRYGEDDYLLAGAETAEEPTMPDHITNFGLLIGKAIVPYNGGSFTSIQMVSDNFFTGTSVSDHGSLGGLDDDDHTQYARTDGTRQFSGSIDVLGNIVVSGNVDGRDIATLASTAGAETLTTKKYQLSDAFGTDHTAEGTIINDTAGENLVFGDLVYQNSDGKWWKSDANNTTTMPATALAIATIAADAAGEFLLRGTARDDSWTWTVGAEPGIIYASATGGYMTQTAPSGTGVQVQVVANSIAATIISFNPSSVLVEIGTGGGGSGSSTASIYCSAESAYLPATNPAALVEAPGATVYGGYSTLDYDTTTDEHAVWRIPVPDYDGGNMTFKFYWFGAATTGNVAWTIESVGVANAEEIVAAVVGDLADVTADTVAGTTLDLNVTTHSTYNPAGVAADDLMVIEITRDVSRDTMAGDAKLMSFLLEYERS